MNYEQVRERALLDLVSDPREVVYAADRELRRERERAEMWEWVARQASEFYIECRSDDERKQYGVVDDDGTSNPYYWLYDVDEMLRRYAATHPEEAEG